MNCKRVHTAGELGGERLINQAMALDPALTLEGLRYNINSEMSLPARPVSGVTLMLV
jgi:hypothetical protein